MTLLQSAVGLLIFTITWMLELGLGAVQPMVTFPPRDQAVTLSAKAVFGVIAAGSPPLSYQWCKEDSWIPGATNDQLVIPRTQFSDFGRYSVIISNYEGAVTSATAMLTITAPAIGELDVSFGIRSLIDGRIFCVAVQPNGKVLIGGSFTHVAGAKRGCVARLNAHGVTDYTFMNGLAGVNPGSSVNALLVQSDGKILIGGSFTNVNGVARPYLARLNADGSLDYEFAAYGIDSGVHTMLFQRDGKLLVGTGGGLLRLNLNGAGGTLPGFGLAGPVFSIAERQDGNIWVAGSFFNFSIHMIGALLFDEGYVVNWVTLNGSASSVVAQADGSALFGGVFTPLVGNGPTNIARVKADGELDLSFQAEVGWHVSAMATQPNDRLLVGGQGLARLNQDGSVDATFLNSAAISAMATQSDGSLIIVGDFTSIDGLPRNHIANLTSDGALLPTFSTLFDGAAGANSEIYAAAVQSDRKVIIAGRFSSVNGVRRNRIARLNAEGDIDTSFQDSSTSSAGTDGDVHALATQADDKVLIGGAFGTVNGFARKALARLNADGSLDATFVSGFSDGDGVAALALQRDGKILVGGGFTAVKGTARTNIARLNPDGSFDESFQHGSGANGAVRALALQKDDRVVLGGWFTSVNGVARSRIARLNPDGSLDADFLNGLSGIGSGFPPAVLCIAVQDDGKLLVGGNFSKVNNQSRTALARLNADGSLDNSFNPSVLGDIGGLLDSTIASLALQADGKVLLAGNFSFVNNSPHYSIARLTASGDLDGSFQAGLSRFEGILNSVVIQRDGSIVLVGSFSTVNGELAANFARLWGSSNLPPVLKEIRTEQGNSTIKSYTVSNRVYRVQFVTDLATSDWTNLPGDVAATNNLASWNDLGGGSSTQRFYRVLLLP